MDKKNQYIPETSQHTSFIDYEIHFTEIPKKTKTNEEIQIQHSKESSQQFYLKFYLVLAISFSNNFIYMSTDLKLSNSLIVSLFMLLGILLFSMGTILCEENEFLFRFSNLFNRKNLICVSAVIVVAVDPNTFIKFFYTEIRSSISSLQTLLLLSAISFKYSEKPTACLYFLLSLSVLSIILNRVNSISDIRAILQFTTFIVFVLTTQIYLKVVSSNSCSPLATQTTTGVEEITKNLEKVLGKIQHLYETEGPVSNYKKTINKLKAINQALRQTPNIYSANITSVLKDMDKQDKIFIEQACFESYHSSKRTSKVDFPVQKERESIFHLSELLGILKNIGKEWNFNTFFIANWANDLPLQIIGSYTIKRFGLDEIFGIPEGRLNKFMQELEQKYHKNPYHNSTHASDVMCSSVFLLESSDLIDKSTSLELLANILSALAHDAGHPGKNNRFIVMSRNDIATLYNDISVLEMMHSSILFRILKNPEFNILGNIQGEKWSIIRKDIIDMILATDMGKHFELLGLFKTKYLASGFHDLSNAENRADFYRLIIKAADIGHAAKSIELHEKWCWLVVQEFYEQGDMEKKQGIPVSMYCDRDNTDIGKSQSGFIKNIVFPLFSSLNIVLDSKVIEESCIKQLVFNQQFWENYKASAKARSFLEEQGELSSIKNSFLHQKNNK